MGVDAADYDGDGRLDLAVTALAGETFPLYRNEGGGVFREAGVASGLGALTVRRSGWGIVFGDFDNDGAVDLFTANSHVNDRIEQFEASPYLEANRVYRNVGRGKFADVSATAGEALQQAAAHRGAVAADFDGDGRLDVVTTALGSPARLWRNVSAARPLARRAARRRQGRERRHRRNRPCRHAHGLRDDGEQLRLVEAADCALRTWRFDRGAVDRGHLARRHGSAGDRRWRRSRSDDRPQSGTLVQAGAAELKFRLPYASRRATSRRRDCDRQAAYVRIPDAMRLSLLLPPLAAGLILAGDPALPVLPIDQGAAGVWQKIQKLQTTASLLHTTAHPDDEQGGLLTMASRGWGARTALVTLNRGEAGDNAIGAELFDALGLIRTDELARAAQYYGLDEQYFTSVADYGYSKRLDEAFAEWDRDALLRDLVRVIRRTRPLVVVSRWQGSARDGHGQHQAAGAITPPAVEAAGDPTRFPELEKEGLRAWRVPKLYLGGARENEGWHVRVDPGEYDPVLGDSYQNLGRLGLSLQRSQTSGRFSPALGSAPLYFTRVGAEANAPREAGLFDGLDTSLAGAFDLLGRPAPAGAIELLAAVSADARAAKEAFSWTAPSAAVSALARGLAATRRAREKIVDPDVAFLLDVKARQFSDALAAAAGLQVTAIAQPAGLSDPTGPFAAFAAPPTLDAVTPGQTVDVRITVAARAGAPLRIVGGELSGPAGTRLPLDIGSGRLTPASPVTVRASLTVPADAPVTRPYFARSSIGETRYTMVDAGSPMPFAAPAFVVSVDYDVEGTTARVTVPVMRREAQLPYGYALRELEILPPVALSVSPGVLIVPTDGTAHTRDVQVDVVSYAGAGASGEVRLEAPAGWTVTPATQALTLTTAGSRARLTFRITTTPMAHGIQRLRALAVSGGRTFTTGYQVVRHRDLPLRYLVREASALVSAFEVKTTPASESAT